jgi:ankyrin repeat protein
LGSVTSFYHSLSTEELIEYIHVPPLYIDTNHHGAPLLPFVTLIACERVDVNAADLNGITAIYSAAMNCHDSTVRLLVLCERIDINASNKEKSKCCNSSGLER